MALSIRRPEPSFRPSTPVEEMLPPPPTPERLRDDLWTKIQSLQGGSHRLHRRLVELAEEDSSFAEARDQLWEASGHQLTFLDFWEDYVAQLEAHLAPRLHQTLTAPLDSPEEEDWATELAPTYQTRLPCPICHQPQLSTKFWIRRYYSGEIQLTLSVRCRIKQCSLTQQQHLSLRPRELKGPALHRQLGPHYRALLKEYTQSFYPYGFLWWETQVNLLDGLLN